MSDHEEKTQQYSTWGDKLLQHTDVLYSIQSEKTFKPINVQLAPCEMCDSDCPFCSVAGRPLKSFIPFDKIKKCLEDFRSLGAKSVELSVKGDEFIPYYNKDGYICLGTIENIVNDKRNVTSFSINNKGRKTEGKITDFIKHKQIEPLVEITLETGRSITVTKSHSVFFFNPKANEIFYKPISEAKLGEYVVLSKGLKPKKETKEYSKDFIRLLGYFIAEGSYSFQREHVPHGINFTFNKDEIEQRYIEDVKNIIENLGYSVSLDKHTNKTTVRSSRKELHQKIYNLGTGERSQEKKVPNVVFNVSDDLKLEFLKGLFAGDGNFRQTLLGPTKKHYRNSLCLKTSSKNLIKTVSFLLDSLDVHHTILYGINKKREIEGRFLEESQYYTLNIENRDGIEKLSDVIRFMGYETKYKNSKYSCHKYNLKAIEISSDSYALPIKKMEVLDDIEEYVYDISVDNTERFLSSFNILCHNTGGGNPMLYRDKSSIPTRNLNDVIDVAYDLGFNIGIITNSHKFKPFLTPERYEKIDWLRISLIKLDEGVEPEQFDLNGFPEDKLGFSYIIYETGGVTDELSRTGRAYVGTTPETIEKIARMVQLYPGAKFVRLAGNCLIKGNNAAVRDHWKPIVDKVDELEKFFIKDIGFDDDPFNDGCYVGAIRPYVAPNPHGDDYQIYICTSHVLNQRTYDLDYSLGSIDDVLGIWDRMSKSYAEKGYPYEIKCNAGKEWKKDCKFCYYKFNNKLLHTVAQDMPDRNFP